MLFASCSMQGMKTPAAPEDVVQAIVQSANYASSRESRSSEERARFRERFTVRRRCKGLVRARKCGCGVSFRDIDFTIGQRTLVRTCLSARARARASSRKSATPAWRGVVTKSDVTGVSE